MGSNSTLSAITHVNALNCKDFCLPENPIPHSVPQSEGIAGDFQSCSILGPLLCSPLGAGWYTSLIPQILGLDLCWSCPRSWRLLGLPEA